MTDGNLLYRLRYELWNCFYVVPNFMHVGRVIPFVECRIYVDTRKASLVQLRNRMGGKMHVQIPPQTYYLLGAITVKSISPIY